MSDTTKLYFAYGSNINLDQMEHRCPKASAMEPVTLDGYELSFRAGGVATVLPKAGAKVEGLLWEITPECEKSLDGYEGYPRLYEKEQLTVYGDDGYSFQVMAYVMTEEYSQQICLPSAAYFNGIYDGYEQNEMDTKPLDEALRRCYAEVQKEQEMNGQCSLFEAKKPKKNKEKEHEMASDVKDILFTEYELFGLDVIVCDERVDRTSIPEGLYCYDIRHSDSSFASPVAIEDKVMVNHYGTLIAKEPIVLDSNKENPDDRYRKVTAKSFRQVARDISFDEWASHKRYKVVIVEPMSMPRVEFIDGSLEGMQGVVGGLIEPVYPFSDDNAVVVVNEEGKLMNLAPNRFLVDENTSEPYDILCGTFFVVGDGGDEFKSLTDKQVKRYMDYYSKGMLVQLKQKDKSKENKSKDTER